MFNDRNQLKIEVETLIEKYKYELQQIDENDDDNDDTTTNSQVDNGFIDNLMNLFFKSIFKDSFKSIETELPTIKKNIYLCLYRISNVLFDLKLYDISEKLLEFTINEKDTNSLELKMTLLTSLSACYWKQSKFNESLRCMNLEYNLVSNTNDLSNKYRILGNIANAYQLLDNSQEAQSYFKLQLSTSLKLKNRLLTLNSLNSIGNLHMKTHEYTKCLECYEKSLELINLLPNENQITKKLLLKQYKLIGECYLKLNNFNKSKEYFIKQYEISNEILSIEKDDSSYLEICKAKFNLALIDTKLNAFDKCVENYELIIEYLLNHCNLESNDTLEVYFKLIISLININLSLNNLDNSVELSCHLLELSIKEQNKVSNQKRVSVDDDLPIFDKKRYRYLKFIELCSCSKLANCYMKLKRPDDSLKLYLRELKIAKSLNNFDYQTRALSHIAQIEFIKKNYQQCLQYYEDILLIIENTSSQMIKEKFRKTKYSTLANIGLCMELLDNYSGAKNYYLKQLTMAKELNNLKFVTNSLLNITNLTFNRFRFRPITNLSQIEIEEDHVLNEIIQNKELKFYLNNLLDLSQELNDCYNEYLASKYLAFYSHLNQNYNLAIKYYLQAINLYNSLKDENPQQFDVAHYEYFVFNISYCFKCIGNSLTAYKYQLEYLNLVRLRKQVYLEYQSLACIAELVGEIDSNYDECIQIHINRLKLLQEYFKRGLEPDPDAENEREFLMKNKLKLIAECLSSIAKCYYLNKSYQQVFKFKLFELKLRIQSEGEEEDSVKLKEINKEKFKIILDLGNLLLFKMGNIQQATKYYEHFIELSQTNIDNDMILIKSLAYGNIGICKMKSCLYEEAIEFFKQQTVILDEKLNSLSNIDMSEITKDNLVIIKHVICITIDKGRSNAKISKCYDLLGNQTEKISYLLRYVQICESLYSTYAPKFIDFLSKINPNSIENFSEIDSEICDDENAFIIHNKSTIIELLEQIIKDYDLSLYKLSKLEDIQRSIELNEKRLTTVELNKVIFNANSKTNFIIITEIKVLFTLATLYHKMDSFKICIGYCNSCLDLFRSKLNFNYDNFQLTSILIKILVLVSSLNILNDASIALNDALEANQIVDYVLKKGDLRYLKLKNDCLNNLVAVYIELGQLNHVNQVIYEFIEFLEPMDDEKSNEIQFQMYLKLISLKIEIEDDENWEELFNRADILVNKINKQEEAAILNYFKGKFYRRHKFLDLALEMFVNSLDSYENLSLGNPDNPQVLLKLDELYELIIEILIKLNKLKEALLVTERLRNRSCLHLNKINYEFNSFDKIQAIIEEKKPLAIIYFHLISINSTINCWLIQSGKGIAKFHQISFKSLQSLFCHETPIVNNFNFIQSLQTKNKENQNELLKAAYDILIEPFELNLFEEPDRKKLIIVYDQNILNIPFHLLLYETHDRKLNTLSELFDIYNVFSLKFLVKSPIIAPERIKIVKYQQDQSLVVNARLVVLVIDEIPSLKVLNDQIAEILLTCDGLILIQNDIESNKIHDYFISLLNFYLNQNYSDKMLLSSFSKIFQKCLVEVKKKYSQNNLLCLVFGRNFHLNRLDSSNSITSSDSTIKSNSDYQFNIPSLVTKIIDLNSNTIQSSLLNVFVFLLNNYVTQFPNSSRLMTSFESLERRINFIQNSNLLINEFKYILKSLGFVFSDKNLIKFPDVNYFNSLKYVLRCLNILKNIPQNAFDEIYNLAKENEGIYLKEFMVLIGSENSFGNKNQDITLNITSNQYKKFKTLFDELQKSLQILSSEFIRIEINRDLYDSIIYYCSLFGQKQSSLDDSILKPINDILDEKLTSYQDDDLSSIYSNVSTILGLPIKFSKPPEKRIPLVIEKKDDEINKTEQYSNKLHKMIEINVDTESQMSTYDKYLSYLLNNDLNQNQLQEKQHQQQHQKQQQQGSLKSIDLTDDSEYKWECLMQYEEEQRIRKMVTTINTRTKEEDQIYEEINRKIIKKYYDHNSKQQRLVMHDSIAEDFEINLNDELKNQANTNN